jgi:hypothetical protein
VLLTGGDNDSFPLWYLQVVEGVRPDVATVTAPLLGAEWYRAEVAERHGLLPIEAVTSRMTQGERLRVLASHAARARRPLAVSTFIDSTRRAHLSPGWRFDGLTYHAEPEPGYRLDVQQAAQVDRVIPGRLRNQEPLDTPDRAPRFMARALRCPSLVARSEDAGRVAASLDSTCNFR